MKYTINEDELHEVMLYEYDKYKKNTYSFHLIFLCISLFIFVDFHNNDVWVTIIVTAIISLIISIFLLVPLHIQYRFEERKRFYNFQKEISIVESGISLIYGDFLHTTFKWKSLISWQQTDELIWIEFLSLDEPLIIPKRVLKKEDKLNLIEYLKEKSHAV